jgi:hypothetical protein
MRAISVLVVVCALAAALPAAADAATWKGKTRQGRAVVVRTDADAIVNRVRIGWQAHCAKGQWYKSRTLFLPPLDSATTSTFAHAGSYRAHPDGYQARIWVRIAGNLDAGDQTWSGTFRVRVRVFKGGERVDTCRLRRLRWSAAPA